MTAWIDPNAPGNTTSPRVRMVLGLAGAGLTLVVVATLVAVVLVTKGVDYPSGPDSRDLVLTAANATVPNPFAPSVVKDRTPPSQEAAQRIADITTQMPYFPDRGVRQSAGIQPGLYGTPGTNRTCNAAAAATALQNDSEKARAWATAIGVRANQIPHYLNTLTPVALTVDTWVTSHGYVGGKATPFQTVLQAGNAVMIDEAGVPRMHCESANPLTPPDNRDLADYRQTGEAWPEFKGEDVVAVAYTAGTTAMTVTEFSLIDLGTGESVIRQAGNTIDLTPPAAGTLPDPIALNAAPR